MLNNINGNIRTSQCYVQKTKILSVPVVNNNQKENINITSKIDEKEKSKEVTITSCETKKIKKFYLDNILTYELFKSSNNYRSDFLKNHRISAEIRARMVN